MSTECAVERVAQGQRLPRERQRIHAFECLDQLVVRNVAGESYFFIGRDYEKGRGTIASLGRHQAPRGTDVGSLYHLLGGAKDYTQDKSAPHARM